MFLEDERATSLQVEPVSGHGWPGERQIRDGQHVLWCWLPAVGIGELGRGSEPSSRWYLTKYYFTKTKPKMPGIFKTETKKIVKKYSQFHHCKDNTYIWRQQYTVQCILATHLT